MATSYVFLDVETTGLSPRRDAIIQLSLIKYVDDELIATFDSYVDPQRPIPPESTSVNGITDDMVVGAPLIEELGDPFLAFIDGTVIVGYNILFDLGFLNHAFHGALSGAPYIDVLGYARDMLFLPNYKLETVSTSIGFYSDRNFHNSLADCQATAAVFYQLGLPQVVEAPDVYQPHPGRGFPRPQHVERRVSEEALDPAHPLYGKKIVFTGELPISREEAEQRAVDVGAELRSSVSHKTDVLVVGVQDPGLVGPDGLSTKQRKAKALNSEGRANISILTWAEFSALCPGEAE